MNGIMIHQPQHPSIPLHKIMIGTTIHLIDLELRNDKGHLLTRIYRDPKTDEYELPNRFEYHTNQPSSLLKAALKHAVRCCSNQEDFHNECRHLQLSHLIRGFSPSFIHKCIEQFYKEFNIKIDIHHLFTNISYETFRQHVISIYEEQKQNIIHIPYPDDWSEQWAIKIKDDLLDILKDSSNNKETFNDIEFEFVPRAQTPLTINDYLVDKRPPLCLLTLSNNA